MLNQKRLKILISFIFSISAFSNIPNLQTTRLKSTGGAGVGSVLLDEAVLLNPAPLAFYRAGSIYLQQTGSEVNNAQDPYSSFDTKTYNFIASDTKSNVSGSLGYSKQRFNKSERKRFSTATAKAVGKKSSLGLSYWNTKERIVEQSGNVVESKYNQISLGFFHSLSPSLSMGILFVDPLKEREEETRAIVGFQYVFKDMVSIMVDAGADYNEDLSESFLIRAATQLKVYNDFFLRVGVFKDEGLKTNGNGVGIGWVQPRLLLEFAFNNTKYEDVSFFNSSEQKLKETSLSLAYRF